MYGTILAAQQAAAQAGAADLATIRPDLHAERANDDAALRELDARARLLAEAVYQTALAVTQTRYTGQVASGLDVARAQDQLQSAHAAETDVGAQRALHEHAIASLTGQPASSFPLAP